MADCIRGAALSRSFCVACETRDRANVYLAMRVWLVREWCRECGNRFLEKIWRGQSALCATCAARSKGIPRRGGWPCRIASQRWVTLHRTRCSSYCRGTTSSLTAQTLAIYVAQFVCINTWIAGWVICWLPTAFLSVAQSQCRNSRWCDKSLCCIYGCRRAKMENFDRSLTNTNAKTRIKNTKAVW